jgi:hypothetical protein
MRLQGSPTPQITLLSIPPLILQLKLSLNLQPNSTLSPLPTLAHDKSTGRVILLPSLFLGQSFHLLRKLPANQSFDLLPSLLHNRSLCLLRNRLLYLLCNQLFRPRPDLCPTLSSGPPFNLLLQMSLNLPNRLRNPCNPRNRALRYLLDRQPRSLINHSLDLSSHYGPRGLLDPPHMPDRRRH